MRGPIPVGIMGVYMGADHRMRIEFRLILGLYAILKPYVKLHSDNFIII